MTTVEVGGTPLAVTEQGCGEPVILVHGSASDRRTWTRQVEAIAPYYRVVAYSRRYHRPNLPIPDGADYSMAEHVADLRAVIEALGSTPVHVVGHSYGAVAGLLLALEEPELFRSLVLCEPPAFTLFASDPPRPSEIGRLLFTRPCAALEILKFGARGVSPATGAMKRGDIDRALEVFGRATLGSRAFEALSDERLDQARSNLIGAELLGSGFPDLDPGRIAGIRLPVLLVGADSSPRLFRVILDELAELIPAERIEIPRASHILHEDNPEDFNRALLSFLGRVSRHRGQPDPA